MENLFNSNLTGQINQEILDSIMGQLSDGRWENSPSMEKYWKDADFVELDGTIQLKFKPHSIYSRMSSEEIGKFFARKIKTLVKEDVNIWKRGDNTPLTYLGYKLTITVGDAYRAYDALLGRKAK